MSFKELGLHATLLKALSTLGYTAPTPVQKSSIAQALLGKDLLVSSRTGSGKTAAFLLPILDRLANEKNSEAISERPVSRDGRDGPRNRKASRKPVKAQPEALILTPTRELCLQITEVGTVLTSDFKHIHIGAILGGIPYGKQMLILRKNPKVLVATPGRLMDHLRTGNICLSKVQVLVLDEADRMLDMGFIHDMETIISETPDDRQTLMFTATLNRQVEQVSRRFTYDAHTIQIASDQQNHKNIKQALQLVENKKQKDKILGDLLNDETVTQAFVFTATKRSADQVADLLKERGFAAASMHGDMSQHSRNRTLDRMRCGKVSILVATDVAARGIDIPNISHVFNYDIPRCPEDYVHRIGRTGRGEKKGTAISLVSRADNNLIRKIERFIKRDIPMNKSSALKKA